MRFSTGEVAAATGGVQHGPEVVVDGASIDSRLVRGGELFVPIVAERDGHDFIAAALEAGAVAYLTARDPVGGSAVAVADTATALADLGAAARSRLPGEVVGVTGSVGKTSVKDLLAAVMVRRRPTVASERNFNNELGVPLTLLAAREGCVDAVLELGARGRGHIRHLCGIARPTVGVVTVVAAAHTELFGSLDDVADAKGELVEALPPSGTAVLNQDDQRVRAMAARTEATVLGYGTETPGADVGAEAVKLDESLRPRFRLVSPWGRVDVALEVRGRHQVGNALAAAAAALASGASLEDVAGGLAEGRLSPWRMELGRTAAGALVLNDAYNANPASVAAALRSLADLDATRRVAVLGTMAELGPSADEEHRAVAELARSLGVHVIAVAEPAYGDEVEQVPDVEAALEALGPVADGDAVLVKASRSAGLERLADALQRR